jgi:hypothetical protein
LEAFISYCQVHKQPIAGTLFEVVGPIKEYLADVDERGAPLDLNNHLGLQMDFFLTDRKEEEKNEALHKQFWNSFLDFKCDCGKSVKQKALLIDPSDGLLKCDCGTQWALFCTGCRSKLEFNHEKHALHCPKCDMPFK